MTRSQIALTACLRIAALALAAFATLQIVSIGVERLEQSPLLLVLTEQDRP